MYHSKELRQELEKKDIKPLKDSDPKLLLDYITIEKEDKVKDETLTDEDATSKHLGTIIANAQ